MKATFLIEVRKNSVPPKNEVTFSLVFFNGHNSCVNQFKGQSNQIVRNVTWNLKTSTPTAHKVLVWLVQIYCILVVHKLTPSIVAGHLNLTLRYFYLVAYHLGFGRALLNLILLKTGQVEEIFKFLLERLCCRHVYIVDVQLNEGL